MISMNNPTRQFLSSLPFFTGLPESDFDSFLAAAHCRHYTKQQTVFLQNDPADRLFIVERGWIKLYRETTEGDEAFVGLYTTGGIFGEAAVFKNTIYPSSACAAEDSILIEIPGHTLQQIARSNHDITSRVMSVMSQEMRNLQTENEHLALMSAPQRVGCLLLQLSAGIEGKGGSFLFPYDKSLAAMRLGMKPETFSRALAQLKPIGVAVKGSEIIIQNFSVLIDFCCDKCSSLPGECRGRRCEDCSSFKGLSIDKKMLT